MIAKTRCTDMTTSRQAAHLHDRLTRALLDQDRARDAAAAAAAETSSAPTLLNTGHFCRRRFARLWDNAMIEQSAAQVEKDFFISARNLQSLYGLKPPVGARLPFPANIRAAHRDFSGQLRARYPGLQLIVSWTGKGRCSLATRRICSTNRCVYFLEIKQLVTYLKTHGQDHTAKLLLSMFSFLVKTAAMPYYTDKTSYLHYEYTKAMECMLEDDYSQQGQERKIINYYVRMMRRGMQLKKLLLQPLHLEQFAKRIMEAKKSGRVQTKLINMAERALQLNGQAPPTSIMDGQFTHAGADDAEQENLVFFQQIFSVMWSFDNCKLYEYVKEFLNCEFGEKIETEEPMASQFFDKPQSQITTDISFVTGVMKLVGDLVYFLNYNL